VRHHETELRKKRRWTRIVRQRVQRAKNVFFAHGEACADRIWIDADALELLQQLGEPLAFRHSTLPRDRGPTNEACQLCSLDAFAEAASSHTPFRDVEFLIAHG
jgi:hypothetical protein